MRMNKKKSLYEAPTIDILVVQFEGALLQASVRSNSANSGYDDDYNLGEI